MFFGIFGIFANFFFHFLLKILLLFFVILLVNVQWTAWNDLFKELENITSWHSSEYFLCELKIEKAMQPEVTLQRIYTKSV